MGLFVRNISFKCTQHNLFILFNGTKCPCTPDPPCIPMFLHIILLSVGDWQLSIISMIMIISRFLFSILSPCQLQGLHLFRLLVGAPRAQYVPARPNPNTTYLVVLLVLTSCCIIGDKHIIINTIFHDMTISPIQVTGGRPPRPDVPTRPQ